MSNGDEKKLDPRWSQLDSIARGIHTIFRGWAQDQVEFGVAQLYRIWNQQLGTFVRVDDMNEPGKLCVKLVSYIKFLQSNGIEEKDPFTFNHVLKELANMYETIVDYESWRCGLPKDEQDLHVQFDLNGLYELVNTARFSFQQSQPSLRRPKPMVPNKLPENMEHNSVEQLLRICRDRNIIVPTNSKNDRHLLMELIANNAEFVY
jgi:hypothetical protein